MLVQPSTQRNLSVCFLLAVVCFLLAVGCGQPKEKKEAQQQPIGYAEALTIYNNELAALDRLEAQRDELRKQLDPTSLDLAGQLLGQSAQLQGELMKTLEDVGDPSGVVRSGKVDAEQKEQIARVEQQIEGEKQKQKDQRQEVQKKMDELDKQIEEQKQRVERAKADKEAAEARRQD